MRAAWATALLALPAIAGEPAYSPRVNFQLQCMGCHHGDGAGDEGRVPSLRRTLVLLSGFNEGRDYVVRVPGVSQSPLDDAQTAALLNWMVRNLSDLPVPDGFRDYTADEVTRVRHKPLAAVREVRSQLLARVAE
jgi:hypothetical protein